GRARDPPAAARGGAIGDRPRESPRRLNRGQIRWPAPWQAIDGPRDGILGSSWSRPAAKAPAQSTAILEGIMPPDLTRREWLRLGTAGAGLLATSGSWP